MEKRGTRLVQRGFTLITALAFTLVVGTILAGVGTVAVSHLSRSKVEGTYANSIALADAGINVELARISSNTADATLADQAGSAREGSIAGIGDYSVYVIPWGSNCDGTGTWKAPGDMCILSTGKVDGISRTVRVRGIRKSIFDEYALFAYIDGTFSGGGVSSGSTEIVGQWHVGAKRKCYIIRQRVKRLEESGPSYHARRIGHGESTLHEQSWWTRVGCSA
jgi:type II secretory pathway pseudopilin PulG